MVDAFKFTDTVLEVLFPLVDIFRPLIQLAPKLNVGRSAVFSSSVAPS